MMVIMQSSSLVSKYGDWALITGASEGIGRASTRSVVMSSMVLIIINILLVRVIFLLFPAGAL